MRTSCEGCVHYLGGGCCRLNLESECAAGGRELWEEEDPEHEVQSVPLPTGGRSMDT